MFQTFNLLPVLSAEENVEYPLLQLPELTKEERRERVAYYLKVVQLTRYARHRPNQLSGGQRQRVAIARALATKPKIVLADEPTANLDHKTGEGILELMKEINRVFKTTFIFSTHDKKVMAKADRLVRIEDGQIRILGIRADARWLVVDERRRRTRGSAGAAKDRSSAPSGAAAGHALVVPRRRVGVPPRNAAAGGPRAGRQARVLTRPPPATNCSA